MLPARVLEASMGGRRWKFWGWGCEGDGLSAEEERRLLGFYRERIGLEDVTRRPPPAVEEVTLRAPRLQPPASLAAICTSEPYERLLHSYGKSFPEAVRIFARDFGHAPDVVAKPASDDDVSAVLGWAAQAGAAVIPFGAGSSVVGGVEPAVGERFAGSTDCSRSTARAVPRVCRAACWGRRWRAR
jgi:alkyldihydroxyacetonephosphate synthase